MEITQLDDGNIEINASVKINLALQVLGKRKDGYHDLDTLMLEIPWGDSLTVKKTKNKLISLTCHNANINNEQNLALKSAKMYQEEAGVDFAYEIVLDKKVPIGSGLGGGSADSVAVMLAQNKLNPAALPFEKLKAMQDKLGSDTSFFLKGGLARCRGKGEQIEALDTKVPYSVYLIFPGKEISTKNIFENHKASRDRKSSIEELIVLLKTDIKGFAKNLFNDLEETVFKLYPKLKEIKNHLEKLPFLLKTVLSGSGSTFFALVPMGSPDYSEKITEAVACRTVFIPNPHLNSC